MYNQLDNRRLRDYEYSLYDGCSFITFNIVDISEVRDVITVAVTNEGKISLLDFDLVSNGKDAYFEYGVMLNKVFISDFESQGE